MIDGTWFKCRCTVCGQEIAFDKKILQPEIFVCKKCRDNAKKMLAIKE